jgi:hypothetical protein
MCREIPEHFISRVEESLPAFIAQKKEQLICKTRNRGTVFGHQE